MEGTLFPKHSLAHSHRRPPPTNCFRGQPRWPPQVISYAEDEFECRRVLMLQYFGERDFQKRECRNTCDNCKRQAASGRVVTETDVTPIALAALDALGGRQKLTLNMLVDCLKGCAQQRCLWLGSELSRARRAAAVASRSLCARRPPL